MASPTECGIIELTLNNEGGDLPVTYTITDPRDVTCQVQLVVNPGNSCTYTMEGFAPGTWIVPISAEDGWGNVTAEDQEIDVDCCCSNVSVEVTVDCDDDGNALVGICVTSPDVPADVIVVDPSGPTNIPLSIAADATECTNFVLPCGTPWTVEVYECANDTPRLAKTINILCDCEATCGTPSVEAEVNCGDLNATIVTLCLGATGGDVNYEITNPETSEVIVVVVADGTQECIDIEMSCGSEWIIPIDACGEFFSQIVASCDCICPKPLDIQGFTPCRSGGLLGDGNDLRVLLVTKGAQSVIAEIKPISGQFTRVLDGTSELTLNGVVTGRGGELCCEGWEEIRTWATEILVYRDGRDAWCGPVTDVSFEYGTIKVDADDITSWWDRRTIPNLTFTNDDLTDIAVALNDAAMQPDPSPNVQIIANPTGVAGTRQYVATNYQYVGDAIDELAKTGLDYTAYGRYVLMGGEEVDAQPYITLLDEHWSSPPKIRQRGNDQATVVVVKFKGGQAVAYAESAYLDYYGEIVRVFDEPNIEDEATAKLAAETRVDLLKDAFFIETPTGAGLKTSAPITVAELIPGMRIRVDSQATCRQVVDDFRLQKVTVNFDGTVAIDLQPLGHTTGDGSGDTVVTT